MKKTNDFIGLFLGIGLQPCSSGVRKGGQADGSPCNTDGDQCGAETQRHSPCRPAGVGGGRDGSHSNQRCHYQQCRNRLYSCCCGEVRARMLEIGNFADFGNRDNTIALSLNDCMTAQARELPITQEAFPDIEAGNSLPIRYTAKVSAANAAKAVTTATVVFTIAAAG